MKCLFILFFSIYCHILFGQIRALQFGAPIKWLEEKSTKDTFYHMGIDTISFDTIKLTLEKYQRRDKYGNTLEELFIDFSVNINKCGGDGYKLSGHWIAYYQNGQIKELGTIVCNYKADDWLYFYPNGQLMKFENYLRFKRIADMGHYGLLSGMYKEYYPNGKTKTVGTYRIVDFYTEYVDFDYETYEEKLICCRWVLESIKFGMWVYYDDQGNIIEEINETFDIEASENYREITDKFIEEMKD